MMRYTGNPTTLRFPRQSRERCYFDDSDKRMTKAEVVSAIIGSSLAFIALAVLAAKVL